VVAYLYKAQGGTAVEAKIAPFLQKYSPETIIRPVPCGKKGPSMAELTLYIEKKEIYKIVEIANINLCKVKVTHNSPLSTARVFEGLKLVISSKAISRLEHSFWCQIARHIYIESPKTKKTIIGAICSRRVLMWKRISYNEYEVNFFG
jgi:hypothetical protein